jgi:DNA-binding transcriptional ArsR family regulator
MRQPAHPTVDQMTLSSVLFALSDPIRLGIVRTLSDRQEHLRDDFDAHVAQSTLSHHMKTLREAGLVYSRPEGTRCYISLRPEIEERFPRLLDTVLNLSDGTTDA